MSGSRLALDDRGRTICIAATGEQWLVLDLYMALGFTPRGRAPTREELRLTRFAGTYRPVAERRKVEPGDDQLAEEEAIRLARLEQERAPADLLAAA
jgi:hypothetical protein